MSSNTATTPVPSTKAAPASDAPSTRERADGVSEGSKQDSSVNRGRADAQSEGTAEKTPANRGRADARSDGTAEKALAKRGRADARSGGTAEKAPSSKIGAVATTKIPELQRSQYAIETYLWKAEGYEATGTILSQSLQKALDKQPGKYAGDLTLGYMRKIVPGMSSFSKLHKFCTASGIPVTDESRSVEDYLSLDLTHEPTPEEKKHAAEAKLAADKAEKEQIIADRAARRAKEKEEDAKHGMTEEELAEKAKTLRAEDAARAKKDDEDAEVARKAAKQAAESEPAAAKQKVPKLNIFFRSPVQVATAGAGQVNLAPSLSTTAPNEWSGGASGTGGAAGGGFGGSSGFDASGNPLPSKLPFKAPDVTSIIKDDLTLAPNVAAAANWKPQAATLTAGNLTETEWNTILRNCAVMYGWKIDLASGQIVRAPRPAFQLRSKIHKEPTASLPMFASRKEDAHKLSEEAENAEWERSLFDIGSATEEDVLRVEAAQKRVAEDALSRAPAGSADNGNAEGVKAAGDLSQFAPKPDFGIPNFRVNDDSLIEIHACTTSFATSLAKADFSAQSIEASLNGGAYGVQVGASASAARSQGSSNAQKSGEGMHKVVARYMFPRCDLFLRPEDLEPTPEFATLLDIIKTTHSIEALRQVHDRYGQLFCQELTLGGRLMSTKIITSKNTEDLEAKKEQFKVSVGANVQSPYGGGGMKASAEGGNDMTLATDKSSSKEDNIFEAVGGDTILANNPTAWSATVAYPSLWRVINRQGLQPLIEMVSEMNTKYRGVQRWFYQAIPALQKYIGLDEKGGVNARLKIESPQNSLHIENHGRTLHYLGFDPETTVTPYQHFLSTTDINTPFFWLRSEVETKNVLFSPASYRSPSIFGFVDGNVGSGAYGSVYNKEFVKTQWRIISPFGENQLSDVSYGQLRNESLVILQTVPFPSGPLKPGDPIKTPPPSHMVVFRNAEGLFMPGMSDRSEYQYWRIQKVSDRGSVEGEPLKSDDEVRLIWKFSDQKTGFRDFYQDSFGRRRIQCPSELESVTLHLKVPWPRFEPQGVPTALVMSQQADTESRAENLSTRRGVFTYVLQDLKMRLDTVSDRGTGDSSDYMLAGVNQKGDATTSSLELRSKDPNGNPGHEVVSVAMGVLAFGSPLFRPIFG